MLEPIIESLHAFFVMVFRYEIGTTDFYISAGSALITILIVARFFARLFGSSKGIFITAITTLLPLLMGAIGYVSVELYALPKIGVDVATTFLPWAVFGVVVVVLAAVVSTKLWGLGAGSAVAVFVLAGLSGMAAQYSAQFIIEVIDSGSSQVEQRDDRLKLELDH